MVNINKSLLTALYMASLSIAMPSQPNLPQPPSAPVQPAQPFFSSFVPSFVSSIWSFGGGSGEGDSSLNEYREMFWKAVAASQGYIPDEGTLNSWGIASDSKLYDEYTQFWNKFQGDILTGSALGAVTSAALDYVKQK